MSKAETNRAILRAFGDAARAIAQHKSRPYAWAEAHRLRREPVVYRALGFSRRRQAYARGLALAADTAFGG